MKDNMKTKTTIAIPKPLWIYLTHWERHIIQFSIGFVLFVIFSLWIGHVAWIWWAGFICADPFTYFLLQYRKRREELESGG